MLQCSLSSLRWVLQTAMSLIGKWSWQVLHLGWPWPRWCNLLQQQLLLSSWDRQRPLAVMSWSTQLLLSDLEEGLR